MYTCAEAPTVYRNSFEAQWTELKEQRPCYSAAYINGDVAAEWSDKRNNLTHYGGLSFWAKQGGEGRGNGYS